jgi:hypothetical protein
MKKVFISLIVFNSIMGCNSKQCQPILLNYVNAKFIRNELNFKDTIPDEIYSDEMKKYNLNYIKQGFNKQLFRIKFSSGNGQKQYYLELFVDSINNLGGYTIDEDSPLVKKDLPKESLCKMNNEFLKKGFTELVINYRTTFRDYSKYHIPGNCNFLFEFSSRNKYEFSQFFNPYYGYKKGITPMKAPMDLLDIVYKYVNAEGIKKIIETVRREAEIIDDEQK